MSITPEDTKFFQTAEAKFDARLKKEIATVKTTDRAARDWSGVRRAFEQHGEFLELHPESTEVAMTAKPKNKKKSTAAKRPVTRRTAKTFAVTLSTR